MNLYIEGLLQRNDLQNYWLQLCAIHKSSKTINSKVPYRKYSDIESKDFMDPLQYQIPKNGFRRFCFKMGEIVKWSEEDRIPKINLNCELFLHLQFDVEIVFSHKPQTMAASIFDYISAMYK